MKKEKACYIVGLVIAVLTILISTFLVVVDAFYTVVQWNDFILDVAEAFSLLQWLFSILVVPVILYISYWHCKKSKLKSFAIAFINDYFCIFAQLALYHISTKFLYLDDSETMLLSLYFFAAKFIISAIALLIYIFKEREWTFEE